MSKIADELHAASRPLFEAIAAAIEGKSTPAPQPQPQPQPDPQPEPRKRGVMGLNLGMGSGAEGFLPGTQGQHYMLPVESEIKRAVEQYGVKRFRIGGLWERCIKPGGKSEVYLGHDPQGKPYTLTQALQVGRWCKKYGATILWDLMHNYGGYSSTGSGAQRKKVGATGGPSTKLFAKDWAAIIKVLRSDPDCWEATYGIDTMNEWVGVSYATVFDAGQQFLDECAPLLDKKMAVFEGADWSSTINWVKNNPDYHKLKDPRGPGLVEFSGHLYLDQNAGGGYATGDTISAQEMAAGATFENIGVKRAESFFNWLEKNGVKGSIGETIVPGDFPGLLKGMDNLIREALDRGVDVYVFGMSDWFGKTAHHNVEIARNKNMLELVKTYAKAS